MNLRINQTVKVTKKCKTNECLSLDSPEAGPWTKIIVKAPLKGNEKIGQGWKYNDKACIMN